VANLGHGVARRSRLTRRRGESGQSLTETIIALTIVLAIFFGLVHLSLLAVTRHVCNYAAFAGARASLYNGAGDQTRAEAAARAIVGTLGRGTTFERGVYDQSTYRVVVLSPFAYPLFNNGGGAKIYVASAARMYAQPSIPEEGDNAAR
jgi:hypothetical protein